MKIINVSQAHETEAWLDERVGRITGTKAADLPWNTALRPT